MQMKKAFINPEEKIKSLVSWLFVIDLIASGILAGVLGTTTVAGKYAVYNEFDAVKFFSILICGILFSYTQCLLLYGFADLIEACKHNVSND